MRRRTALLVTLLLCLTSCIQVTSRVPAPVPLPNRSLSWLMAGVSGPSTLDPAVATDAAATTICSLLFQGLVGLDARLRIVPAAAAWWWRSPNGRTYTFHLRRNLRYSDGSRITAQDVVQSFQRAMTFVGSNGIMSGYLSEVATAGGRPAIFARSSNRVTFELSRTSPAFLAKLAFAGAGIVDTASIRRLGAVWTSHPIGSGPYRLLGITQGNEIRLQRNPYFQPKPPFQTITIGFRSQASALQRFMSGHIDVVSDLGNVGTLRFQHIRGLRVAPELALDYVMANVRRAPLSTPAIRQALSLSVDRYRAVEAAFHGDAEPQAGLVPSPLLASESRQRLDTALALFELGGSEHPFGSGIRPLHLIYPASITDQTLATELSRHWRKTIGLHVVPDALSSGDYQLAIRAGRFDLALVRWRAEMPDAQNFLGDQLAGGSPQDFSGWSNQRFDQLLQLASRSGIDSRARLLDLSKAEAIAARAAPWIPLDSPLQAALIRPGFQGLSLTPLGIAGLG